MGHSWETCDPASRVGQADGESGSYGGEGGYTLT